MATQVKEGERPPRTWPERLVRDHRATLLAFAERRVGSRAAAEELLQAALLKALEHGVPADDEAAALRWFYRVLRNLVIDHYRTRGAEGRALDQERLDLGDGSYEHEHASSTCACVHDVLPTLKPEYASIVRAVHLEERSVQDVAEAHGLTSNNASVRLHRARAALREGLQSTCGHCAAAGCLDCTCRRPDRKSKRIAAVA